MIYDKFNNKAEKYDKYRPKYSKDFIDYLYDNYCFDEKSIVADIGAGTGILSEEFLLRNSTVMCVEPNKEMLEQAKKRLLKYKNVSYINAPAENTTISDSSINYITVGQAFHWFDKEKFLEECKRILTKNGMVVLAWNISNSEDEINMKISNLNSRMLEKYNGFNKRDKESNDTYSDFFNEMECHIFDNNLFLNAEDFVGRCLSRSYAPNEEDKIYNEYVKSLYDIFDEYAENEKVKIKNITKCLIGKIK